MSESRVVSWDWMCVVWFDCCDCSDDEEAEGFFSFVSGGCDDDDEDTR